MTGKPKVVVIGAGSYFFGKPVIYNMIHSPVLNGGTLALVDTDPAVLETMTAIAERARAHTGVKLDILSSTDRTAVMKDADFVVLSSSFRNAYYRELDTRISRKYGVTMCSSDTIGPGGIFRALRELPEVLRIADDVRRLEPVRFARIAGYREHSDTLTETIYSNGFRFLANYGGKETNFDGVRIGAGDFALVAGNGLPEEGVNPRAVCSAHQP